MLWWVLYKAENVLMGSSLRKMAMTEIMKHIHYEVRINSLRGNEYPLTLYRGSNPTR